MSFRIIFTYHTTNSDAFLLPRDHCLTYTIADAKIEGYTVDDSTIVEASSSSRSDIHLDWFWEITSSWAVEGQQALFVYLTGHERVPVTDQIKVVKTPDGDIQRVNVPGNLKRRALPVKDGDAPEHILFIPPFDSYEEMERCLISIVFDEKVRYTVFGKVYEQGIDILCSRIRIHKQQSENHRSSKQ